MLLFAWVLVEQLGIPLPATPVLIAAGALSAEVPNQLFPRPAVRLAASLTPTASWFLVGRRYGHHVLRILCKLSLDRPPVSAKRKTP